MDVKTKKTLKVAISGAAGQIAYSLIPFIISGETFGAETSIDLRLLDIEPMKEKLSGVVMEIEDCFSVSSVIATSSAEKAFVDADYAILVGGFPRKQGMERKDLLAKNSPIFVEAGKALSAHANKNVKVLVVANPANTNALVLQKSSSLPPHNVTALSRLDVNRAVGFIAKRFSVSRDSVSDVFVFGNHSKTQVPDTSHTKIGGQSLESAKSSAKHEPYTREEFDSFVQSRGQQVIAARGLSSAMSAACAIKDHLRDWHFGTGERTTCMSVMSNGNPFGVAENLFFSFPVRVSDAGVWEFASEKSGDERTRELIRVTEKELEEEKKEALEAGK